MMVRVLTWFGLLWISMVIVIVGSTIVFADCWDERLSGIVSFNDADYKYSYFKTCNDDKGSIPSHCSYFKEKDEEIYHVLCRDTLKIKENKYVPNI